MTNSKTTQTVGLTLRKQNLFRVMAIALLATAFFLTEAGLESSLAQGQLLSPPPKLLSPKISAPIRTLLTEDWKRNSEFQLRSKITFKNAGTSTDDLLIGYTINRMRHNRISEAKQVTQELTNRHSDNLDGWVFKTWLNVLTEDFDVALIDMRSLKKKLDQSKDLTAPNREQIYKRLGRLIGYMQGPMADRVDDNLISDTVRIVATGLKPETLKLFNEGRDKVLKEFADLTKTQLDRTQQELVKVKVSNDAEAVALERQVKLLERTESQLLPEKQRIRDDASKLISSIQQQGSSAELQINQISADLRATQLDLQYMYQDLSLINQLPPRQRGSTFNLQNQIRNAELTANALRANGVQVNNQLNTLQTQLNFARNNLSQQLNTIEREIKKVNGAKRRNLAKLGKLAKGPKVADGKRESMRSRVTALKTYDEISLELYRQELLGQLSN